LGVCRRERGEGSPARRVFQL